MDSDEIDIITSPDKYDCGYCVGGVFDDNVYFTDYVKGLIICDN